MAALNEEWDARAVLYRRALAASPYYRSLNALGRSVLEENFTPINARYVLENPLDAITDTRPIGFREWLGRPRSADPDYDFRNKLLAIQRTAGPFLPQTGQDLDEWITDEWRAGLYPRPACNPYYELLEDEALTFDLILNIMARGINPGLRQGYLRSLGDSILAWQDKNPHIFLFAEFARRGFIW